MKHQGELGHLKHMLKRPMSDNERNALDGEIEAQTKKPLNKLIKFIENLTKGPEQNFILSFCK